MIPTQPIQPIQPTPFMGNTAVPPYLKYSSVAILLVTYFGVLAFAGYTLFVKGDINAVPAWATFILGTGLTQALNLISQHVSSTVGEQATTQATINQANQAAVTKLIEGGVPNVAPVETAVPPQQP